MAVDEALLRAGESPTLRLYRWDPHGVSLGYFQRAADFPWDRFAREGSPSSVGSRGAARSSTATRSPSRSRPMPTIRSSRGPCARATTGSTRSSRGRSSAAARREAKWPRAAMPRFFRTAPLPPGASTSRRPSISWRRRASGGIGPAAHGGGSSTTARSSCGRTASRRRWRASRARRRPRSQQSRGAIAENSSGRCRCSSSGAGSRPRKQSWHPGSPPRATRPTRGRAANEPQRDARPPRQHQQRLRRRRAANLGIGRGEPRARRRRRNCWRGAARRSWLRRGRRGSPRTSYRWDSPTTRSRSRAPRGRSARALRRGAPPRRRRGLDRRRGRGVRPRPRDRPSPDREPAPTDDPHTLQIRSRARRPFHWCFANCRVGARGLRDPAREDRGRGERRRRGGARPPPARRGARLLGSAAAGARPSSARWRSSRPERGRHGDPRLCQHSRRAPERTIDHRRRRPGAAALRALAASGPAAAAIHFAGARDDGAAILADFDLLLFASELEGRPASCARRWRCASRS